MRAWPTMVGGEAEAGAPAGNAARAKRAGSGAFARSPSTQCAMPGIEAQFVHCQNDQPLPPQPAAGVAGAGAAVQWASQSPCPEPANAIVSPSLSLQKFGEA